MKHGILVVLSLLLLAGCAGGLMGGKVDTITVTAETAATVADRAVRTNALYKQFCPTGAIKAADCAKWAAFYPKFQREYGLFYATYKGAVLGGDITSAQTAAKALEALSDQLLIFYLTSQGGR